MTDLAEYRTEILSALRWRGHGRLIDDGAAWWLIERAVVRPTERDDPTGIKRRKLYQGLVGKLANVRQSLETLNASEHMREPMGWASDEAIDDADGVPWFDDETVAQGIAIQIAHIEQLERWVQEAAEQADNLVTRSKQTEALTAWLNELTYRLGRVWIRAFGKVPTVTGAKGQTSPFGRFVRTVAKRTGQNRTTDQVNKAIRSVKKSPGWPSGRTAKEAFRSYLAN